jgi:hypothetical protein
MIVRDLIIQVNIMKIKFYSAKEYFYATISLIVYKFNLNNRSFYWIFIFARKERFGIL